MPSQILRSTNPTDWTAVDGVYINEQRPPSPISGLSNDVACVVGNFQKGPVDTITAIGSKKQLISKFGGYGPQADGTGYPGYIALLNKPFGRLYVIRCSNGTQGTATVDLQDGDPATIVTVNAASPGVWGNSLTVNVADASDGNAAHWNLEVLLEGAAIVTIKNLNTNGYQVGDIVYADDYVSVVFAADGRPVNASGTALTTGSDGTFADSDYTGAANDVRGIQLLYGNAASRIRHVFFGGSPSASVKTALYNLAVSEKTKYAYLPAGASSDDAATAVTAAGSYRSDRVFQFHPWIQTYVAEANNGQGGLLTVSPASFGAALVAGIKPGEDPAGAGLGRSHANLLYGIRGLSKPDFERADYVALNEGGVAGFQFASEIQRYTLRNGVTSSLDDSLRTIARRTVADYIQESLGLGLVTFQNVQLTADNKEAMRAAVDGFLRNLQGEPFKMIPTQNDLDQFKNPDDPQLAPYIVDIVTGNTAAKLAQGIFVIIVRVRTFPSARYIVLTTEIGESVEITEQAA